MLRIRTALASLACLVSFALPRVLSAEDVQAGKPAPNFALPSADGKTFELASLKGKQPVVVVFSRGHWCPFCSTHMRQLQKSYAAIEKAGAELVVVFREDDAAGVKKALAQTKAEFPMLVDQGSKKTKGWSPEGYDVYVVDKEGVVAAVLEGTKPSRPSPEDILGELEKLGDE